MNLKIIPKTDVCMGRNYNNSIIKTTYYSDLSTSIDLKKRDGKRKTSNEKNYNINILGLSEVKISFTLVNPEYYWE